MPNLAECGHPGLWPKNFPKHYLKLLSSISSFELNWLSGLESGTVSWTFAATKFSHWDLARVKTGALAVPPDGPLIFLLARFEGGFLVPILGERPSSTARGRRRSSQSRESVGSFHAARPFP